MEQDKEGKKSIGAFQGTKKKVAIVGYAPSSRLLAPYNDTEFEIWGVNELYKLAPRIDVLFEMHNRKWFRSKARNPKHLEWLQKARIPIITLEKMEDIPKSVAYPIREVQAFFSPYEDYFTNSISFMIALAIMLAYDEIHLYGIDMATSDEYKDQRPSVEFFCGIAYGIYKATGKCLLYVPPESDLMKTMFLYGYETDKMIAAKKKMKARELELTQRRNHFEQQIRINDANKHVMIGALDNMKYIDRCIMNDTINYNEEERPIPKTPAAPTMMPTTQRAPTMMPTTQRAPAKKPKGK